MNKVELSGEIYTDVKHGTSKSGEPWTSFKLKVMNGKYYSAIPIYAPGVNLNANKGDSVSVKGELVEQYRANKSDPVQFQVKIHGWEEDSRGTNPEIDDIDLAF